MHSSPDNSETRSNSQWVDELSIRDEVAIRDLVLVVKNGLIASLKGKMDDSLADDLAQESVLRILAGLASYRGDSQFKTWAMAIAMRVAFTELRRARYKDVSLDLLTSEQEFPAPASYDARPESVLELNDLCRILHHLIDTVLSERQRRVIRAELDGVPQSVLCEKLGTNRNAFYKMMHDARIKLKNALLSHGFSEFDVRSILASASNP